MTEKKATGHEMPSNPKSSGWRSHLKAVAILFIIVLNLSFWLCPLLTLVLLKWLFPLSHMRKIIYFLMSKVYQMAAQCDSWILFSLLGIQLEVEGIADAYPGKFYLVIANHQSWSDILILQHLLNGRAPVLKFLVKRELIYLPLVGLICWAYEYPFLYRRNPNFRNDLFAGVKKDASILNRAMTRFLRFSSSVMIFVEGTRYSKAKAHSQNSPYRYLLKPKAGGLTLICNMLRHRLAAIVDVTIVYDTPQPTFWRFISGSIRRVKIQAHTLSIGEIFKEKDMSGKLVKRPVVAEWINERWTLKDREISKMLSDMR